MANAVIVGTQWGDEGKAKVIDYLTQKSDLIIRFQGGANAGHTVIANGQKFIFHLVPSGIMYSDKICIVGNGVVFDCEQFLREIDELKSNNISVDGRLFVSDLAHLVLPFHKAQDGASESNMGQAKIGTTGRGIGPAYSDKTSRTGIRVGDLRDWDGFVKKFKACFEFKSRFVKTMYHSPFDLDEEKIIDQYRLIREQMLPYINDTACYIYEAASKGKNILYEGAQGTFLDIDHGTYPFVTSSNTLAGYACPGCGVGPSMIDHVIGIVKVYTTRVGNGPFPTELNDSMGETLRKEGGEFGATTGRPRRCGWFDSVMIRKAVQLNGITRFAFTKLDVLNNMEEIQICTHYEIDGKKVEQFPSDTSTLEKAVPIYETVKGWKCDISECKTIKDLPTEAIKYIHKIQELCYNIPILIVSIGPDRNQTIEVEPI